MRSGFVAAAIIVLMTTHGLARHAFAETVLKTRLNGDILSTEPGRKRDENTDAVLMQIGEGLVAFKENSGAGPLLAESIDVSEDGLTYLFHLRKGVKFHNGALLTSAEVVWSLKRYLDPEMGWRCLSDLSRGGIAPIVNIQAIDPETVSVTLEKPAPLFLKTLARIDCAGAAIMHPDSLDADGEWVKPIGTGPFRFGEKRSNQYIDLLRYEDYSSLSGPRDGNTGGKKALVDRVRFVIIPDSSAARAALASGAIDVLYGVSPSEVANLKGRSDVKLQSAPTMDIYALLLQTTDPVLADPRMRRAIALSLDLPSLTAAVSNETGRPNSSPVPTETEFHKGIHTKVRQQNLAKARKLAREAGYKGQAIQLIANKRYPMMFNGAVLVQAMAQQAGINFKIETFDWATQLDRYITGNYQSMSFSYSARLDPSFGFGAFMGAKEKEPRKVWDDPVAEELLNESMVTADPVQRQKAFDALLVRLLDQTPLIVLYNPSHVIAARTSISGVKGWPAVQPRLWGVGFRK